MSPAKFVRIYREEVVAALREAEVQESQLLVTRYEDFTRAPSECFRKICEFIGEPYVESCLDGGEDRAQPAVASKLLYGPVATNAPKWRAEIDDETAHRVERALAPVMASAGFRPYT